MLFKIIFCLLVVYVCLTPIFYAKAMKFGMKLVANAEKAADEPIFNIPVPKKKPKMTAEQDRITQIMQNIDRYDGTSNGQVKVEVKR